MVDIICFFNVFLFLLRVFYRMKSVKITDSGNKVIFARGVIIASIMSWG